LVQTLRLFLVYFTRVLSLVFCQWCLAVWDNEVSSLLVSSSQLVLQFFLSGDFFEARSPWSAGGK